MPFPASGGAPIVANAVKAIRLAKHGCTNRPFFHIVVMEKNNPKLGHVIEQLGIFDPMPNVHGEKLCSLNMDRIVYWIGEGADVSKGCMQLFGMTGLLTIHPYTYKTAWINRQKKKQEMEKPSEGPSENNDS